jgi:hypothetical protein
MEQRVLIKCLREEGHGSTQIHSKLVEHYGDKAVSYPGVSYWGGSFQWGEKTLKIGGAAEDCWISKLISESMEHSKHRPMLQFKTLLRLRALLRQRYFMCSFKIFVWNLVTGDDSYRN